MKCQKCGHRKAKGVDCKFCHRERAAKAVHHLEGCLRHRFRLLMNRTRGRHWPPPDFTLDQFLARFLQDPDYLRIHARWTASGFKKSESPSVDRIDPRVPYLLENIRIVPWPENHAKGATTDRELGTVDPAQWCPDGCSGYAGVSHAGVPDNLDVIPENEEIPDWL